MSNDSAPAKKTMDEFIHDRSTLQRLHAPTMRFTEGSDRDIAYRAERSLDYALDMIGHLLVRIEELEARNP